MLLEGVSEPHTARFRAAARRFALSVGLKRRRISIIQRTHNPPQPVLEIDNPQF